MDERLPIWGILMIIWAIFLFSDVVEDKTLLILISLIFVSAAIMIHLILLK